VPVEVIELPNPDLAGLPAQDYEVIGEKVTYRLAQRPGAYVVPKYVRKVVKLKAAEALLCPAAPPAVLERSIADVSLLAGVLLDKFCYHLRNA
jgi:transposase